VGQLAWELIRKDLSLTDNSPLSWADYFLDKERLGKMFFNRLSLLAATESGYRKAYEDLFLDKEIAAPEDLLRTLSAGAVTAILEDPVGDADPHPAQRVFVVLEAVTKITWKNPAAQKPKSQQEAVAVESILMAIINHQPGGVSVSRAEPSEDDKLLERTLFNAFIFLSDSSSSGGRGAEKIIFPLLESQPKLRQSWERGLAQRLQDPLWKDHQAELAESREHWLARRYLRCQRSLQNPLALDFTRL
jgi:hypothetical protein